MSAYEVSVVIPSFNHGHLLERAVYSAISAGAAEVVIVDDCSTDRTEYIGRGLAQAPQILYLRNPFHAGVIYSRNRAVYAANYELILPLDADDKLLNIGALVEAWTPGHWVYGSWVEDGQTIDAPPPGVLGRKELGWITMLFAKSDWATVGGYDPVFSLGNEVWQLQRALYAAGVMPVRVSDVVFHRSTMGLGTAQARAWAHVIKPLIEAMYPYEQITPTPTGYQ